MKALLIIALVLAFIIGGILFLKSSARTGMPSEEVLRRAQQRAKELKQQEHDD